MASMSASQFKANAMLRRFAIPRLPTCNCVLFLQAPCLMPYHSRSITKLP